MARNRKYQAATVRFGPALKVVLLCSFIVAAAVGYVWQKEQLVALGQRKQGLERKLAKVKYQTAELRRKLMELQSPRVLETRVAELRLGLRIAQPNQIVPLPEPAVSPVSLPEPPLQYVGHESVGDRNRLVGP